VKGFSRIKAISVSVFVPLASRHPMNLTMSN
jgi:hypothetical protein